MNCNTLHSTYNYKYNYLLATIDTYVPVVDSLTETVSSTKSIWAMANTAEGSLLGSRLNAWANASLRWLPGSTEPVAVTELIAFLCSMQHHISGLPKHKVLHIQHSRAVCPRTP